MCEAYEAIGGIIKTLKNHRFFLCFEHSEVLGRALEILLEPWELLSGALGGSEASLGAP